MTLDITQNRRGATHNQAWGVDEPPSDDDSAARLNQNSAGAPVDTSAMRRAYDCCGRGEYPRPFVDRLIGGQDQGGDKCG